jgi:hypothetical protein
VFYLWILKSQEYKTCVTVLGACFATKNGMSPMGFDPDTSRSTNWPKEELAVNS